uniref:Putative secreted protein n=1 Tax=Anopheles triannulatus TaxID=58253 RepID=A0A2M4B3G6_9DIPT
MINLHCSKFALRITNFLWPWSGAQTACEMFYIYASKSPSLARYTSGTRALVAGSSEATNFSTSAALWIPVSTSSV